MLDRRYAKVPADCTAAWSRLCWASLPSSPSPSGYVCTPRVLRIATRLTSNFGQAYDASKKIIFALTPNRTSEHLSIGELATAGFMSAVPTTFVTGPVERAKVMLQIQGQGGAGPKLDGVTAVVKHLYKEGGLRSVFRGTGATLARDGPGSAA